MISVVLATHNEEKNLKDCLRSIQPFADEIVIADGESTDNTINIAKKFGARIIPTTNKQNFHINKQLAMDKATGDLILQLDADEQVDEQLAKFITKIHQWVMLVKKELQISKSQKITNPAQAHLPSAWWIKRKNWFLGKFLQKGGQYPDPVIRLYLAGQAQLPQQDVHEQMRVKGEVACAEGHLLHYGNPTFSDYVRKWNTYTSFRATQWKKKHLTISVGHTFYYLLVKPVTVFGLLFFRHKGFVDGVPGFVFAAMSGLHFPIAYLKLWELEHFSKRK